MTNSTFKEKSMKRQSLVTKEASKKKHQNQGRPNHTHNPPNNFPQHQTHQKGGCTQLFKEQLRIYVTFGQQAACIRGFWTKTCIYIEDSGKKKAKGQTNKGECQWMTIL